MPLAEIVFDFYDRLKTVSKGYASFDYSSNWNAYFKISEIRCFINAQYGRCTFGINSRSNAYNIGKKMCEKLRELIPRQQFDIPIQAAIGAKLLLVKP
jgi:GTP-binding protein LepA